MNSIFPTISVRAVALFCGLCALNARPCAADTIVEYQFDVVAGFEASHVSGILFDDITTSMVAPGSYFNVGNIKGDITIPSGSAITTTPDGIVLENLNIPLRDIEGDILEFSFDSSNPAVPQAFDYTVGPNGIGNWVATVPDGGSTLVLSFFSVLALAAVRRFKAVSP